MEYKKSKEEVNMLQLMDNVCHSLLYDEYGISDDIHNLSQDRRTEYHREKKYCDVEGPKFCENENPILRQHFDDNLLFASLVCHQYLGVMEGYKFIGHNFIRNNGLVKEEYVHTDYTN